ncbi:MAG: hypothetical protein QOG93_321, partial [Gaiellaceae bacterium]|nr:hypothetical protein [Gaiellaceae bacterium]
DHSGVLNGHLPARERNEASPERDVPVVEWSPEQGLSHRGRC